MNKILIIGCGDIGRRVAKLAIEGGGTVTALARSEKSAKRLEAEGVAAVRGDLDGMEPIGGLPTKGATVFYFAPPPGGGMLDTRVRVFCASVEPGEEPAKLVYISTSGVYGDCGGATVTEETPVNPQTARARRRLDAETLLAGWGKGRGIPVVILRVTGIYGPGRLPLARIREGHPVLRPEDASYTNRIHADDLVRVCLAAAEKGEDGEIFNVSDGQAGTMTEYFEAVADAAGLPRPPRIGLDEARKVMTPLMLSYIAESRRMDNARMLEKLGVQLLYPTLEAGLRASLEGGLPPLRR
ncbi:MAG: NAD(P)-dependent oxidoreductase [Desulfuromonas sp.]|uniref:SDR family oxidoreductase n=1 Tax=Desulfuromonas sp. TaxID=892 RepID=UPI000CAA6CC4|nr:SDR family oxidoreductase [Desulfuromonas sp.]PLX85486.1 MAG: NAD(P)-dependent oxidoreductase [Desulfuromonas sp.]